MAATIPSRRAFVRPRVVNVPARKSSPKLLEEVLAELLASGVNGNVVLLGGPGSGKTAALRHLASIFEDEPRLCLIDEDGKEGNLEPEESQLVVRAAQRSPNRPSLLELRLAPWGEDEFIEYLLAAHKDQCASVMRRLKAGGDEGLDGVPQMCALVFDAMANDETLRGVREVIDHTAGVLAGSAERRATIADACLDVFLASEPSAIVNRLVRLDFLAQDGAAFFRHRAVIEHLASERVANGIVEGKLGSEELEALPELLVQRAAPRLRDQPLAKELLKCWLSAHCAELRPRVAGLLHGADPAALADWIREHSGTPEIRVLSRERLPNAPWAGLTAPGLHLELCDLSGADLRGAMLPGVHLDRAELERADLRDAQLIDAKAHHANLTGAKLAGAKFDRAVLAESILRGADLGGAQMCSTNLQSADLRKASLRGANLEGAYLRGALVGDTDFRDADLTRANLLELDLRECALTNAVFRQAGMSKCNLAGMRLDGLNLLGAHLEDADLTSTSLRSANLESASLNGARLADVDLQGANLRDADLRGAIFHMGTTRSGLIFDAPPMEGSRTGFYADDMVELAYKRPEEIRKANLRGADLRGADLAGADFYLVDLRGAQLDDEQLAYVRRCRAILDRERRPPDEPS